MTATFPLAPLDLRTEINVGGWTDISTLVYQRDGTSPPVSITRGRPNEQSSANPSSMSAQWNNRSGNLSPRNPVGIYYGLLGRNTPVRISVPNPVGPAMRIADDAVSYASCPGSSGLECGADIDIRVDMDPDNWAPCLLAGQFSAPGIIFWSLSLNGDGTLCWTWTDGTPTTEQVSSTMPVPLGRSAVRCWFDPAELSGAPQVLFYTAPTMSGTWTQLGNGIPIALDDIADTSPSAALTVGYSAIWEASTQGAGQYGLQGRVYEVQLRNGTTLAADPVFSAQAAGVTSFTDTQGNTWTLAGSASIDTRDYRGHFEATTLPQRWDPSGRDVWCPVEAKGVLQRLQQGDSPLPSVMRRSVAAMTANPQWRGISIGPTLAYWPGEDNAGSTQIASGLPGGRPMTFSGAPSFQGSSGSASADSVFACSAGLAQPASSTWYGQIPVTAAAAAAPSNNLYLLICVPSGTPNGTLVSVAMAGGGTVSLVWATASGGELGVQWNLGATQTVGGVASGIAGVAMWVQLNTYLVGPLASVTVLTATGVQLGSTPMTGGGGGVMTSVTVNPAGLALGSTEIGHIWPVTGVFPGPDAPSDFGFAAPWSDVLSAWLGETAGNRHLRLCGENGVAGRVYGYPALTAAMGAQPVDTLANLLQYGEDTDRGQVYEPAEALGVGYRTLGSMSAQAAQLALDYAAAQLGDGGAPLEPTDDDQYTLNDVTVSRNNGSSAQVQVLTGTMSILPPPNGVGDYDTQITTYNAWDKDLPGIASWIAWIGTCDQERYPAIPLNLARPQLASLLPAILGMRLGGYFTIANLIAQMPPGTVDQLLFGYSELLGGKHWHLALNAVPEDPYAVAVAGVAHAATAGSELAAGYSAAAASLSVATTAGQLWTTSGSDFPFNIMVSGEEMTVTNITGSSSPQTFTVTRSVNGVVKAQLANAAVQVYPLPVAALMGNH